MTEAFIAKKEADEIVTYAGLKRRVKETLDRAKRAIEDEVVTSSWMSGWYINEHVKIHGGRAEYGKKIIEKLSEGLNIDYSSVQRFSQFAAAFPELQQIFALRRELASSPRGYAKNGAQKLLSYTHYRTLIPLKDNDLRRRLAKKCAQQDWSVEKLEAELRKAKHPRLLTAQDSSILIPKRGQLDFYQIIEKRGKLHLDWGFKKYCELSAAKNLQAGDIVKMNPDGSFTKVPGASLKDLYTYPAELDSIYDGDTYWLDIFLPHPDWISEKFRLRGVDAPEMNQARGRAAKRFVEEQFARAKAITVTTTKITDKWDRYLADVFLQTKDGQEVYLNQLLLDSRQGVRVKE